MAWFYWMKTSVHSYYIIIQVLYIDNVLNSAKYEWEYFGPFYPKNTNARCVGYGFESVSSVIRLAYLSP